MAKTKELESKDVLIKVLKTRLNEERLIQVATTKELESKDVLIKVLETQLNEERLIQAKEIKTCMNQVLEKERQIFQRNEKIDELEDNIKRSLSH